MEVIIVEDFEEMSGYAADIVAGAIEATPDMVLGFATGSTPEGLYARLVAAHKEDGLDFSEATTFNLDEYVGLQREHDQSYHYFMHDRLFNHVNVNPDRVHVPDGMAENLGDHCEEYEAMIEEAGGIDLQILGVGRDGHLAFNEPGTSLTSRTHVTALMPDTVEDNARFFADPADVPRFAVTMGVGSILDCGLCVLMVSGANKADAVKAAVEGPITSSVTASALQLHPNTIAILDRLAASKLARLDFYLWQQENWEKIADRL